MIGCGYAYEFSVLYYAFLENMCFVSYCCCVREILNAAKS